MDGQDFDRWSRTVASSANRRMVFSGLIAAASTVVPAVFGGEEVSAKKKSKVKCKNNTRKCGPRCILKSSCCTSVDYGSGKRCQNGRCVCAPGCENKNCGDDDRGGTRGTCSTGQCDGARCVSAPDCDEKECSSDGCGSSCGTCGSRYCHQNQSICEFGSTTCRPHFCGPIVQACTGNECGACPETPDGCNVEVVCGRTTAQASPLCCCATSLDNVTTCTSVFATLNQTTNCAHDADCAGLLGAGVEMVCVNAP